ncbi:hypothetical protein PMIN01_10385 [Paraphaeosphaeria minitans]|uniref:Uncharacterized protein n=1 Tax=Paraphaeosphaeria minitans TaxID=565426 RepID=A0A9P6GA76_9PLEO|nr:hypothetical protein PMIN01_10385 [Paraphaeosphaeria minitans]
MPLLRSLTTKLKTKLTISPPASPTTSPSASTSSFENLGGERKTWRPQSPIQSPTSYTYTHGPDRNRNWNQNQTRNRDRDRDQNADTGSSGESFAGKRGGLAPRQTRPQSRRADTGSSELSFGCVGIGARAAVEDMDLVRAGREERRRSRFREEF